VDSCEGAGHDRCVAAWGGASVGLYTSGAEEVVGWTLDEVKQAALATVDEVGDEVVEAPVETATYVKYETRFEDGATLTIKLKALSDSATRVKIWVGITGGRAKSRLILDNIRNRLKAMRRGATAAVPIP